MDKDRLAAQNPRHCKIVSSCQFLISPQLLGLESWSLSSSGDRPRVTCPLTVTTERREGASEEGDPWDLCGQDQESLEQRETESGRWALPGNLTLCPDFPGAQRGTLPGSALTAEVCRRARWAELLAGIRPSRLPRCLCK